MMAQNAGASLSCPQKSNPQNASTSRIETKKFGSRTFLKVDRLGTATASKQLKSKKFGSRTF
jgi:hypothetical protein